MYPVIYLFGEQESKGLPAIFVLRDGCFKTRRMSPAFRRARPAEKKAGESGHRKYRRDRSSNRLLPGNDSAQVDDLVDSVEGVDLSHEYNLVADLEFGVYRGTDEQ